MKQVIVNVELILKAEDEEDAERITRWRLCLDKWSSDPLLEVIHSRFPGEGFPRGTLLGYRIEASPKYDYDQPKGDCPNVRTESTATGVSSDPELPDAGLP